MGRLLDPNVDLWQLVWELLQQLPGLVTGPQRGLFGILGLCILVVLWSSWRSRPARRDKRPEDRQAEKEKQAKKYAPALGTPWHAWFWPLFGEYWVIPLAAGWWPRWKWLEQPWANWVQHQILFKIPGLAWRVRLPVTPHIGVIGGTGKGKDAILQWIIEHVHNRAVVNIAMDKSAPTELSMRRARGILIKANGKTRWNLLAGEARFMAERVSRWWRMGENDTGSSRGDFRREAEAYGRAVPSNKRYIGYQYNLETGAPGGGLLGWITDRAAPGPDGKLGKLLHPFEGQRHWANRLNDMALALGTTDGPGGVDVAEVIIRKGKIGFFWDTFRMVSTTSALGVATILDVMRAAADMGDLREGDMSVLPDGIEIELENLKGLRGAYVILNEGGSLENRTAELDLFFKAARARDFRIWAAVQNPIHFGGVLLANMNQWLLFGTGDPKVRAWQSDVLDKHAPAEAFSMGGGLKSLACFVLTEGRLQQIRIQPPDMRKPKHELATIANDPPAIIPAEQSRNDGPGWTEPGGGYEVWEVYRDGEPERGNPGQEEVEVEEVGPMALPSGTKAVPGYVLGSAWPGTERRERRYAMWSTLSGTWTENGDWLWTSPSRNRGYGKASYANRGGWNSHFLFWAWAVLEDRAAGRVSDLDRFYAEFSEIPHFQWPADGTPELNVLEQLKEWMARPFEAEPKSFAKDDPRYMVKLSIDHCCPGGPNTLCCNHRHHKLVTWAWNSKLRHQRRTGEYHDGQPSWEEIGAVV